MKANSRHFVGAVALATLCVVGTACSKQDAPTSPGPGPDPPPAAPPPVAGTLTLRVVSGADQSPVTGATILINNIPYVTNSVGDVTAAASTGSPVDIDVPGFLPRRTSVQTFSLTIALWPVLNEAEADAVRMMVYNFAWNEMLYPPAGNEFIVTMRDTAMMPTDASSWGAEASAFGAMFGLTYRVSRFFEYEQNELEVIFQNSAAICTPSPAWGFCRDPKFPAFKIFMVDPDRRTDPAAIRRVLSSWFLGSNPLPGLMNAQAPSETLSPLELQTIRMILQRRLPNRWPDTDR